MAKNSSSESGRGKNSWTMEEARRDFPALLEAADRSPQQIMTKTRVYTISSDSLEKPDVREVFRRGGPLD